MRYRSVVVPHSRAPVREDAAFLAPSVGGPARAPPRGAALGAPRPSASAAAGGISPDASDPSSSASNRRPSGVATRTRVGRRHRG